MQNVKARKDGSGRDGRPCETGFPWWLGRKFQSFNARPKTPLSGVNT